MVFRMRQKKGCSGVVGAFSSVMKGARLAEQLFKPSEVSAVVQESLNQTEGLNCETCEQVQTLREEVDRLREVQTSPVSFGDDDTPHRQRSLNYRNELKSWKV
jgi:hypothetical protein